ncbi:MAG: 1,4-dihydroxy-2-naphthoate octaprenyltransferase [Prevotella sp.]|nr:1,4-dihydroxy-2-naphthoate octaprenyltransferase [Prevotella sp.]
MGPIFTNTLLWFHVIRPQTLFASLTPVLIAIVVLSKENIAINPTTAILTALCALSLQILSNLINDYYDFQRGADKAGRIGYQRVMAEGVVSTSTMQYACCIAAFCACAFGVPLVFIGGWIILTIGLSAFLFAWLYTATSHSLAYLGLGDIFVLLYYGVIASGGTAYLLLSATGSYPQLTEPIMITSYHAGAVCGLISMCVLMINNLRDVEDDAPVGKRTLPVRIGIHASEGIMLVYVMLMPCFAILAFGWRLPVLVVIPAAALWLMTINAKGAVYNRCLLFAGLTNVVYFMLCLSI